MPEISFTQYVMPDGMTRNITIDRPDDVYEKAKELIREGFRFEAEILSTGEVSLSIHDLSIDEDVAIRSCENGPGVPETVDSMICEFYERWKK